MMAPLSAVAVLLVSTLCSGVPTAPARLKALSISAVEEGGFVKYSILYESPTQAEAAWKYGDLIYDSATDTFSKGQGQSELVVRNPVYGLFVSLKLRGSMTEYYFVFNEVDGDLAVSEPSIRFSPDPISYTPGEPFDISVEIEIEDADLYRRPDVGWFFVGINGTSTNPPVQVITPYDSLGGRFGRTFRLSRDATKTVASSRLTLSSEEGLVFVYSMFQSGGYLPTVGLTDVAYVKQRGHVGPFPADFVGVYSLSDVFGTAKDCHQYSCSIECNGVGTDIVNVELRKGRHGPSLEPVLSTSSEYVQWREFQIVPVTQADQGTYFCTATGRNGKTAERQINLNVSRK
ncbi:uncharacterized protein [Haliotis cracherodii]|uniref:uncharacterized protein n=1 Tax=Haliotis cracherodii TaxID=6455 RepID=UPI0039E7DE99